MKGKFTIYYLNACYYSIVNYTFIQIFILLKFVLNQNVMILSFSKITDNSLTYAGLKYLVCLNQTLDCKLTICLHPVNSWWIDGFFFLYCLFLLDVCHNTKEEIGHYLCYITTLFFYLLYPTKSDDLSVSVGTVWIGLKRM